MNSVLPELPRPLIDKTVRRALVEDLGRAGDITTMATVPKGATASAVLAARARGTIAGMVIAETAFAQISSHVEFRTLAADGDTVEPGSVTAEVSGSAAAILSAERVALNFLGHLSGIATATRRFADAISHTPARITCTRKTTPCLRAFEKYAVRCGGGSNHRFGLDDAILIKDNHIVVAGGVTQAILRARAFAGHTVKIEVEVDTLDQMREALSAAPDIIMLDNMSTDQLREAVAINQGQAILEASGNVTLETVTAIAETGVDFISSGWITHSAPVLDLGLDISIDAG